MGVLYALESIRTPALDKIMSVITLLGGELFFMVIAVTVFWCVSKREGYYLMIVGFFGTVINQFLKILCCVPRPWIKDPDFTIVESARAEATGYSFPSGHTQNAVATYGGIARYTRRGWLRVVLVVLTVLIAFSRMYLGVHTPLDVGVSFLIAAVLVLVVYPLMEEADRRPVVLTYTILAMVVCSGAFVGYLYLRGDTGAAAEDTANYLSALENGWKLLGATLGMLVSNIADRKQEVVINDQSVQTQVVAKRKAETGNPNQIGATMPGSVLEILVKAGDKVQKGQALMVTEAMKMETTIEAPFDGEIVDLHVVKGEAIQTQDLLIEIN